MFRETLRKYAQVASLLFVFGLSATVGFAQPPNGIYICHFHQSGYELIIVPPQAMNGHFDAQGNPLHEGDYISTTPSCTAATPSPTPPPGDDPDPTPEPVTMLLFGAGVAGVGYAVRKLRRKGDGTQE